MRKSLIGLWGLLCIGCGGGSVTVQMQQQSSSGEDGSATLKDLGGGQTQVVLALQPGTDTGAQAAHIHSGSCANLGQVVFPLTSVIDGGSTSNVPSKLSDLQGGKYVINVHNSAMATVYVSCGAIP